MSNILVLSENSLLLDNIEVLLAGKKDINTFTCQTDLEDIRNQIEVMTIHFVLVDLMFEYREKLTICTFLKNQNPSLHIIGLLNSSDHNRILCAFRSGIDGLLTKEGVFNELYRCICTLLQGDKYLSLKVVNHVINHLIDTPQLDSRRPDLITKREREHIACIAEGLNPKEIAYKMKISKKTVDNYRNRIMDKLNFSSIADIVKYAIKEEIVSL